MMLRLVMSFLITSLMRSENPRIFSVFCFICSSLMALTVSASSMNDPIRAQMMSFSDAPSDSIYFIAKIYPLGWSKQGHFALIQENEIAGRGGITFTYIIIDAVSDQLVWHYVDDWPGSSNISVRHSLDKQAGRLSKKLDQYGVVRNAGVRLSSFPIAFDKNTFFPSIDIKRKKARDPFYGDIEHLSVYVTDGQRSKKIFSKTDPGAFSYWIAGYFASPFENRILVAIGEEKWGFEGTEGSFIFSGCLLSSGFK